MNASDEDLISRAIQGDFVALSSLLRDCGGRVRAALQGKIECKWQSVLDPDDIMQVTYLEAFLRIRQVQMRDLNALMAWLTRIAENNLLDAIKELRREKRPPPERRVQPAAEEDSCVAFLDLLGGHSTTPSRQAGRQEVCEMMRAALAKLPADYSRVVRMYDLEAAPIEQVAAALGRSEGAVYMLRARAHDRLREILGATSNFFSDSA